MNKIVFYIRALFHESIMPSALAAKRNIINAVNNFNKYSKISAQDYRKEIHKIQLQNLNKISDRIIINTAPVIKTNTFNTVQEETQQQLFKLDDNDIVILLDDDDWLSPEIANIEFSTVTFWNSFVLNYANNCEKSVLKTTEFFHKFKPAIEYPLVSVENVEDCKANIVLANCQAYSAKLIKHLSHYPEYFHRFMQRHSFVRGILRLPQMLPLIDQEKIYSNYWAAYVRHAANLTCLDRLDLQDPREIEEEFFKITQPFKTFAKPDTIPTEFAWCIEYLDKLQTLHNLI